MHLADEVLDHVFGNVEIGDHAIAQRTNRLDVAGRAAQHLLCLVAHGQNLVLALIGRDRDHGRFVQHDAAPLDVNQRVGRAEIDGDIGGKEIEQFLEHRGYAVSLLSMSGVSPHV